MYEYILTVSLAEGGTYVRASAPNLPQTVNNVPYGQWP